MIRNRLAVVLVCGMLAAGCANIPEQTAPQRIPNSAPAARSAPPQPARDAEPITVVRAFILANADANTSQAYFTEDAKRSWRTDVQPTIIKDDFSTVPKPDVDGDDNPNTTSVEVTGQQIGRLDSNKSFVSQVGPLSQTVRLVRQDGQWRIAEAPPGPVIPISAFNDGYRPVKLWFYDPTRTVLVPDLRYVPGSPQAAPSDIIALLLVGPASGLGTAVRSVLPPKASQRTNASRAADGAMVVNLSDLGNLTAEDKVAIATQIVLSLQDVAGTVRLQVEGLSLMPDRQDWKVTDITPSAAIPAPGASLTGLMVVNGRIRSLRDGSPIPGPAGNGDYKVETAAQSIDGTQLAVVERTAAGLWLRVGGINDGLRQVVGPYAEMTRPTWQFGVSSDKIGNEVWTVADGTVLRMVRARDGNWYSRGVNQAEVSGLGKITDLRLSRDGVRVAVVAGGKLYVGAVVRTDNDQTVSIRSPKALLPNVSSVVGIDWYEQASLAVATNSSDPVYRVPVDGVEAVRQISANLTAPLSAITAAPGRQILVTDTVGMWTTADMAQVWRPHPQSQGPTALPFYPG